MSGPANSIKGLLLAWAIMLCLPVYSETEANEGQIKKWTAGAAEAAVTTIRSGTSLEIANTPPLILAFTAVADDRPIVVEYCLVGLSAVDSQQSKKIVLVYLGRDPYSLTDSNQWTGMVDAGYSFDGSKLPSHVSIETSYTAEKVWKFWDEQFSRSRGMKPLIVIKLEENVRKLEHFK